MSNSPNTETPLNSDEQLSAADLLAKTQQDEQSKLSPEDLARVQKYLSSPIHAVERKPFKSWWMMLALVGVVVVLGFLSQLIAWLVL